MYISPLPTAAEIDVDKLRDDIANKLLFTIGKDPAIATKREWLNATLYAVRDRMVERWHRSNRAQFSPGCPPGLLPVDGVSDWAYIVECAAVSGDL